MRTKKRNNNQESTRKTKRHQSHKLSSQSMRIMKRAWESICKNKPNSLPNFTSIGDTDIRHIRSAGMYSHIPDEIKQEFESTSQQGIKCETKLARGRNAVIYIAMPSHSSDRSRIDSFLTNILTWLNFVSNIASPKCSQTLHIYLLLTDAKKRLPGSDAEPIDMIHANTAFTTSCSAMNSIFVYRREEWFKVFMHETFHCFGLDFSSSLDDKSNERILSLFPAVDPQTDIRLYETFCEMWAELFNLMFCICSARFSEKRFRNALLKEQIFSVRQSNKILKRAGYKYKDLLKSQSSQLYKENTPAFSYYVIKSIMLWNLDRFVKWCSIYAIPKNSDIPIQFHVANINNYCDLVEDMTKRDGGYERATEKYRLVNTDRSLRMTSVDAHS